MEPLNQQDIKTKPTKTEQKRESSPLKNTQSIVQNDCNKHVEINPVDQTEFIAEPLLLSVDVQEIIQANTRRTAIEETIHFKEADMLLSPASEMLPFDTAQIDKVIDTAVRSQAIGKPKKFSNHVRQATIADTHVSSNIVVETLPSTLLIEDAPTHLPVSLAPPEPIQIAPETIVSDVSIEVEAPPNKAEIIKPPQNSDSSFKEEVIYATGEDVYAGLLIPKQPDVFLELELAALARQEIGLTDHIDLGVTYGAETPAISLDEIMAKEPDEVNVEPEIVEIFSEVKQKLAELDPEQSAVVYKSFEELVTVLIEDETLNTSHLLEEDSEDVLISVEEKLTVIVTEIFRALDMEVDEIKVARIVEVIISQRATFDNLAKSNSPEDGTHEILRHIASLIGGVKQVLQPIHTLIGRIVLESTGKLQASVALVA